MAGSLRGKNGAVAQSMNESGAELRASIRRRRVFVGAVLGAVVVVLAALNAINWLFVSRMRHYLDAELGRRLETIARTSARTLDREGLDYLRGEDRTLLALELLRLSRDAQLQAVHIVDAGYRIVASSQGYVGPGEPLHYLEADSTSVERAWSGSVTAGPLRQLGGHRFKLAYAPLHDSSGETVALLVVEASAGFFEVLRGYERARLLGLLASALLLFVLSAFLLWALALFLHTEASLRQAERLATIGQMAATVAHEIRNPLGIIKSTADVLKQRYSTAGGHDELFDFIPQEVARLNRMVDDLLVLSRGPRLVLERRSASEVIASTIARLQPQFSAAGVTLQSHLDENLPPFAFDQDALHQVLLNVLLNALQATPAGGRVELKATTTATRRGPAVRIEVRDTGHGISGDPRRVFEPFYTTKPTGSGLGLTVTQKLVQGHGGWIDVESTPGKGSTFTLYFPIGDH